jgi:phosphocarrier protein HPr
VNGGILGNTVVFVMFEHFLQIRRLIMRTGHVMICTEVGLHARPAAMLTQEAAKYNCSISIKYNGKKADMKSILQVLSLGVKEGSELCIEVEGDEKEEAMTAIQKLFSSLEKASNDETISGVY